MVRLLSRARWVAPALLALGLHAAPLHAAPPPAAPAPLTLAQAFERAWERQPQAQALTARREAQAARQAAATRWTPEPAALETSLRSDRLHQRQGSQEWEFGVAVPLWLPGERARSQQLADAEQGLLAAQTQAARWQLAGELRERWWALHLAQATLQAAHQRRDASQQLAADVARRVQAGELSRADLHQAQAAAAAAAAELAQASLRAQGAAQALRVLLGFGSEDTPVWAADPEPEAPGTDPAPAHPWLDALQAQAERARASAALTRTQSRAHPELTLQQARERGGRGEPRSGSVLFGLRLPLGEGAPHRAAVATAAAEQIEAEVGLARERERLAADQHSARAAVDAARQALQQQHERARLLVETRSFYDRSFRLGETDLPTRLRIEQEAHSAEQDLARARIELYLAIAQLHQALGLLPQ
ncbi:TolC family protein [Inhella sp.]|uniref:TolC family protein n=1 Tax=Inhella sp. TaxID=1921806 RepID=UPI0035B12017